MSDFVDAPQQGFGRLRKLLPKHLQPFLRGLRKRAVRPRHLKEPYYSVYPYTQVAYERQENLFQLAQDIQARDVAGAIVECGVLDGGTAALMAYGTAQSGRPIHLFDSWDGLPDVSEKDGEGAKVWAHDVVGSPKRVVTIMKTLNISPDRVSFHKGWFADTFKKSEILQIALLHIDADFYDSVRLCLERWFPFVTPGGYVQIDDYSSFIGCRTAVDEFLTSHPDVVLRTSDKNIRAFYFQVP
jgi:O-methyltransferase